MAIYDEGEGNGSDATATDGTVAATNATPNTAAVVAGWQRQVPSIGRVVHYYSRSGQAQAAVITEVLRPGDPDSPCCLVVLAPLSIQFLIDVPFSGGHEPGTWDWPPYVPPVTVR
jgi:hypothetical protein